MPPCPDDNDLVAFADGTLSPDRRDAIARHLDDCTLCRSLAAEAVDEESRSEPLGSQRLSRGDGLGRLVVLERVGSGGLGDVFLAYDPELDRRVAVKLLRPSPVLDAAPDEFQARLGREARALAKLAHPNVVHVYDVGRDGNRLYITMEYVSGGTLADWLSDGDRTWEEIRDLIVEAGRGLVAAHAAGIVHRDFKPGNVLVGEEGRPRVVDFGLAREPPGSADAKTAPGKVAPLGSESLTGTGTVLGTPAYMAPEQHRGADIDARVDQFAFCVTMYEALHGVRPFRGDSIEALALAKDRGPPSTAPAGARPPAWLRRVVERGLTADPSARFASMEELLEALTDDRARARRRRFATGGAAAALVGGAALGLLAWVRTPSASTRAEASRLAEMARAAAAERRYVFPPLDEPDRATAYQHVLQIEAIPDVSGHADDVADALRGDLADELTDLGDALYDLDGGRPFALSHYAAALVFAPDHTRAKARAQLPAWVITDLGQRAAKGEFTRLELAVAEPLPALAEADVDARAETAAELLGADSPLPATTQAQLSTLLGMPAEAQPSPDEDVEAPTVAVRDDPPADSRPAESLDAAPPDTPDPTSGGKPLPGRAAHDGPRRPRRNDPSPTLAPPSAAAATPRPVEASEAQADGVDLAAKDPELARQEAQAGHAHLDALRFDEAAAAFHRSLAADPNHLSALEGLSELHYERGRYPKALTYAKRVVKLRPKSGASRIHLGDAYFKVLRYEDARTQYERARELGHAQAQARLAQLEDKLGK